MRRLFIALLLECSVNAQSTKDTVVNTLGQIFQQQQQQESAAAAAASATTAATASAARMDGDPKSFRTDTSNGLKSPHQS